MGNEACNGASRRGGVDNLMAIIIELDVMLARRKMKSTELAELIGITPQNLSVLRSGRAKAIRFSTLDAICQHLQCSPGDILVHKDDE